jgi:glucose-1-phosphate adenylyltransferase
MDIVAPLPGFSLYNDAWPIYTQGITQPPAKITDGPTAPSHVSNSIVGDGVIVHGGAINESVLSRGVVVDQAHVSRSVLMDGVRVEPGARLINCIVDKNVVIPSGMSIGYDLVADRERFTVSEGGVVAIAKGTVLAP